MSLTSKGMARISRCCVDNNFCFVVNGQDYGCNLPEAVSVSSSVERLLEVDPKSRQMIVNLDYIDNIFDYVLNLMQMKVVAELNREETFNIVEVSHTLDNQKIVMK